MAQNFTPRPRDPYDADADELPYHSTAPHPEFDPADPAEHDGHKAPSGSLAEQEAGGDSGIGDTKSDKGASRDSSAEEPGKVKSAEEKGDDKGGGWFRADEDGNSFQRGRAKIKNGRGRLSKLASNKWLVGGTITGGSGIIIAFILLLMIAGSLKIPNLAEHITTYSATRVLRQSVETETKITNEKFAVDSLTQRGYDYAKNSYQGLRDNTWGKFDKYRPDQVIKQMNGEGTLKTNYSEPNILGRRQLKGITVGNQSYLVKNQGASRFIPGFSDVIKLKNSSDFVKNYSPALAESLKAENIGPITRGRIANQIRKELNISLAGYAVGKYKAKSEEKARLQAERDSYKTVATPGVDDAKTAPIKDTTEKAQRTLQQDLDSDTHADEIINNGGSDPNVEKVVEEGLTSRYQQVLSAVNGAYGTGMALCIIYDGSITNSGPTVDATTDAQERAYINLGTIADKQKEGATTGEAVGAYDAKYGDIAPSNPEVRAAGGKVDTGDTLGGQSAPSGQLDILTALLGRNFVTSALSSGLDAGCPIITNPYAAGGFTAAMLALTLVPGFGEAEAGANGAADAVATSVTTRIVSNITAKFGSKEAAKATIGRFNAKARFIAKDTIKSGAKVTGLTVLAKLIVMSKAHQVTNGLEQNSEAANAADAGADSYYNEGIMRKQFYGRPLTTGEVVDNDYADAAFRKSQTESLPASQRYFALSNPDSLLNRMASTTASLARHSIFSSFLSLGSKLFNPLGSMNKLFGAALSPKSAQAISASTAVCKTHYCNVQFGYSDRELNILRLDFTYRMLENKSQLEQSGEEDAIETKYADCYKKSIGDLLADGDIVRDKDGNVDPDAGLCAPNHLSYDSTDTDFQDHMIFRWRVAHDYENGLQQLLDKQEKTKAKTTGSPATDTGAPAAGDISSDAQTVAKEILANGNITYIFSAKEDVQDIADGKPGTNNYPIDIRALQIVDALGKNHKIVVSAYESHGQGHSVGSDHYDGHAVDIANIDGAVANQKITDVWSEIEPYSKNAVFLQGDCPGAKPAPSGMTRKAGDACNHQHISLK